MPRWPRLRAAWGLAQATVVAGAVLLVLTGLVIGVYDERSYREQRVREVTVQSGILAATVTAALAFDDRQAAEEYVAALGVNPELRNAAVYDRTGRLVAAFSRSGDGSPPPRVTMQAPKFEGALLSVVAPVSQDGERLGAVWLQVDADPMARRLARYVGLALLLAMALLVVGVLGAAQTALTRANRRLQGEIVERERAEEALRQSQRMEAMGQLTGGVAHDFNNILMVASSGLDLMERTDDPARRQTLMDGMRQAVERGASLTRQLLAFSRRGALQPQVINLADRVNAMEVLLDRSLGEEVSVDLEMPPDLWRVEVDPAQFELAILNLAVNARDAMPGGGRITISAVNRPDLVQGDLKGDFVEVCVMDTGTGVPEELLGRVFEPFVTTKEVGKGTGLGLSLVYGFARASGGEARIGNRKAGGAVVSIFMPRTLKPFAKDAPAPARVARPKAGQGRVLLVEDDDAVAGLVSGMLEELGFKTSRAANAAEALEAVERQGAFTLVFSDLVMPGGMDGIALARELARRRPDVPILLSTGFSPAAAAAADQGLRLLAKPYGIEALDAAINAARAGRARDPHAPTED